MAVEVRRDGEGLELELTGEWSCREFGGLETELAAVDLQAARRVSIDAGALTKLDLTGAWALHQFVARARAAGAAVSFKGSAPEQLRLLDDTLREAEKGVEEGPAAPARARHRAFMQLLVDLGRHTAAFSRNAIEGLAFLGRTSVTFISSVPRPKHLRVDLDRAPRLRDRHHRHADRGADRLPDQRDHRLHERAAAARSSAPKSTSSTSSPSACCASWGCCSPPSLSPAAPAAPSPPRSASMKLNEEVDALHAIGRRPVRSAGGAARPRAGDRAAAAHGRRRPRRAQRAARCCAVTCSTCR